MGRMLLTLSVSLICSIAAFAQSGPERRDYDGRKDTLAVTENVDARFSRTMASDSTRHNTESYIIDKHAVKAPNYDTFKESMKQDDWLGGLLKDIIFR